MQRRLVLAILASWFWLPSGNAQNRRDPAIQAVISRQLDAFQRNDGTTAFAIASPMIQAMFGDPTTFMSMVARGYPQVYRAESHKFLSLETTPDGRLVQRVLIESAGRTVTALYEMIDLDGVWRINGCQIEQGSDA